MKFFIIAVLITNIYSQCEYSDNNSCNSDSNCNWIEDITTMNCSSFNGSSSCESYSNYGCSWEFSWGGWQNYGSSCVGGYFQIDNGFCEEIIMPECSGMSELNCNSNTDCEWIDDFEYQSCSEFSNENCVNQEGCFLDQDCNQWGSWYSWICYDYGPVYCSGSYQSDNSYCEEIDEIEFETGDVNQDYLVNVADVIFIINLVITNNYLMEADINHDFTIDVTDIILTVNIILGG